jgi:ubiquinone/menaquinone biosynthesis C-methylase UbiE
LKRVHPEGIPWPFSRLYNALSRSSIFQAHYRLVARDVAAVRAEGDLLDVGTGPGWLLLRLGEACPAMRLVGLDISPAMVAQARKNIAAAGARGRIEVCEGSADRLPFPDASFDMVISTGAIHHWKQPVAGLNDIHRVLRPAGRALIYDIVSKMPRDVLRKAVREFGRVRLFLLWLHSFEEPFHGAEELASLAQASRFGKGQIGFVGVLCRLAMEKS